MYRHPYPCNCVYCAQMYNDIKKIEISDDDIKHIKEQIEIIEGRIKNDSINNNSINKKT